MRTFSLTWPWVLVGFAVLAVVIIIISLLYSRHRANLLQLAERDKNYFILTDVIISDNDDFNRELGKINARYKILHKFMTFFFVITVLATAILVARPANITVTNEKMQARDIILCLDVSGSTLVYDREILTTYKQIVSNFEGERIGLSIFNSTSRTVFPLTDDYDLVNNRLDNAIAALAPIRQDTKMESISDTDAKNLLYFLAGTTSKTESQSLIGDGLSSCALQFPDMNDDRPRSIVFSTDNILSGTPIYKLQEAADYVVNKNISLYTIYSGSSALQGQDNETNLRDITNSHNGKYYTAKNASSVDSIVQNVLKDEQKELNPEDSSAVIDNANLVLYLLFATFGGYLTFSWRLKQ